MDEQIDEHDGGYDDPTGGGGDDQPEGAYVPRDDFIAQLVPDPSQPPLTQLLTGFVGDSSEEGHTRIYLDPELSQYVDVPDHAILHSVQLPAEESPLGGSHVWIRADAELRSGSGGEQGEGGGDPNAAGFLHGQLMTEHLGGAGAGGGAGVQNHTLATVCTQAGCFTQQICITHQLNCKSLACPRPTILRTMCSAFCPTRVKAICEPIPRSPFCNQPWTPVTNTPVINTIQAGGGQAFGAQGAGGGVSAQCQMSYGPCPTHLIGCTGWQGCGQTDALGCPDTSTCPPHGGGAEGFGAQAAGPIFGPTGWQGCIRTVANCPTHLIGCTGSLRCGFTRQLGCPRTSTCPPTLRPGCGCLPWTIGPVTVTCPQSKICPTPTFNCPDPFGGGGGFGAEAAGGGASAQCQMSYGPCGPIGHTGWQGCGQQPIGQTGWQGCGQPPIGQTGWQGCGVTDAMGCPDTSTCPPHTIGQTGWQGCTMAPGCPSTSTCPPHGAGGGVGAEAAGTGAITIRPTTIQPWCRTRIPVVCTWHSICRPTVRPPCTIMPPMCPPRPTNPQFGCPDPRPTQPFICTGFVCGAGGAGGGGGFGAEAAGPIGHTGWQGCGVTDAMGCPDTSTCPPHNIGQTGWQGCGQEPIGQTGWQGCGQQPIGQTGWYGCTQQPGCGCLPWTVGPVIPTHDMPICGGGAG